MNCLEPEQLRSGGGEELLAEDWLRVLLLAILKGTLEGLSVSNQGEQPRKALSPMES